MTRPRKNKVEYFPHDCHHGKTISILRAKYKNDGYAFWFLLLERLGRTEGHFIDLSSNIELEFFGAETGVSVTETLAMLDLLSELKAIDKELWEKGRIIWSENFVKNLETVYSKRSFRPEKPSLRSDNNSFRAETPSFRVSNPQSKVKESKVNKTKENSLSEKVFSDEVKKLSDFLFECIKKTNSKFKGDPRKWDEDMDKLIRIDDRPYEEAVAVIMFAQNDSFWRANILSGKKLREKYDQLYMKASGEFQKAEKSKVKSYDL